MKITVQIKGESFDVEVGNLYERPVIATVDGTRFEVWPEGEEPYQHKPPTPRESLPTSQKSNGNNGLDSNAVAAPIPGLIQSIKVHEGDEVYSGQEICILEAMKMKNIIRAPRAGKVSTVNVRNGQQVAQGEVLMAFSNLYVSSHHSQ